MNFYWFIAICLVVMIMFAGCATYLKRLAGYPPPVAIITLVDVHGAKQVFALDHIKGLKVVVSRDIKFEVEYMKEDTLSIGDTE